MTEREALKLALEALERGVKDGYWNKDTVDASTRIKEALAQPEQPAQQEHVATSDTSEKRVDETAKQRHEQEPVAWPVGWVDDGGTVFWKDKPPADGVDLYTTPPQRTWIGLTDEDCKGMSAGDKAVAMWADRTLKEKNT